MKEKILILEDEIGIRSFVSINLKREGYEVIEAGCGQEAIDKIKNEKNISLALLDVMLPDMSGIEVCKYIRQNFDQVGIIMLTAKAQEEDKIEGFISGADDYMVKPFGVLELSARIRSLLRRAKREEKKDTLTFEDIVVNKKTREVTSEGHLCELTLKEFELLVYLMENQSRVVTRDELLNQVWGYEYDGETRTLDMHIRTLRQKLGEKGSSCIKTIRGVGYRLVRQEG